jgi:hypothetical protein
MLKKICAVVLFVATPACADTTWTLKNVTLSDGGTASGSFVLRYFPTAAPVDWNISVAGGNAGAFPPVSYTTSNGTADVSIGSGAVSFHIGPPAGGRTLAIQSVLPESGGSMPINIGNLSLECFNCNPVRMISGGSLEGVAGPGAAENIERWLPIAGSVVGAGGEFFRTNVRVFNPTGGTVVAKISFHPAGRDGVSVPTRDFSIAPRTMLELNDIVGQLGGSGLGALRFGSSTTLLVTGHVFTDSKCTTPTSGGVFGQFVSSTLRTLAVTRGVILHLRSDAQARSNIGFANPTVLTATVSVRVFGDDDVQIGGVAQIDVPPFSATAPTNLEALVGAIGKESVWVSFEATQKVIGYGSVVDARTTDQYFSPAFTD